MQTEDRTNCFDCYCKMTEMSVRFDIAISSWNDLPAFRKKRERQNEQQQKVISSHANRRYSTKHKQIKGLRRVRQPL